MSVLCLLIFPRWGSVHRPDVGLTLLYSHSVILAPPTRHVCLVKSGCLSIINASLPVVTRNGARARPVSYAHHTGYAHILILAQNHHEEIFFYFILVDTYFTCQLEKGITRTDKFLRVLKSFLIIILKFI